MQLNKLKEIREKENLTYQQVAELIGVTKPYYWQIENGKRGLSYELAIKIAAVYNTTPDKIFLST
ncbi:helix-turn-helix transcriptional regulator [Mesobacillus subterraneus]|uniref:helix-turn-helix transcriptional regulator n=1 Tax=Mesobacillus subterraneus TaxID=285983 RepID=UPI001CFD0896|nr:helix-turn-helix transcriptional regulator [Mesobacillus subterraneus]WLR54317.1 helix-turn-helix transcriptional regulator [Mesobacillus subterraneus]